MKTVVSIKMPSPAFVLSSILLEDRLYLGCTDNVVRLLNTEALTFGQGIRVAQPDVVSFMKLGEDHILCTYKCGTTSIISLRSHEVYDGQISGNLLELRKCYPIPYSDDFVFLAGNGISFATLALPDPLLPTSGPNLI